MKNPIVASSLLLLVSFSLVFSSCNNDDDDPTPATPLEATTFSDLRATGTGGHYTFFSLSEGDTVDVADSATTKWDIAFKSTQIIFNSGVSGPGNSAASLQTGLFDEISSVSDTITFKQDSQTELVLSSGKSWYNYNDETHIITPLPGKVLVIRTADGKYAKLEVISYYKGAPTSPTDYRTLTSRYYTFRYVYQSDGSKTLE